MDSQPTSDKTVFHKDLDDKRTSIAEEILSPNTPLLIAFGGIFGALGILPFEFFNLTKEVHTNKIYIRDIYQAWYHLGLPNVAADIDDLSEYLRNKIRESISNRAVLVGNSMGAYAAILFGALLDADEVHAFSPQTFIDKSNRSNHSDRRWENELSKVYSSPARKKEYFDLREVLQKGEKGKCRFHLYFSQKDTLDSKHAKRLENLPNISLHAYDDGGHSLVKTLRDSGALKKIIIDSLFNTDRR